MKYRTDTKSKILSVQASLHTQKPLDALDTDRRNEWGAICCFMTFSDSSQFLSASRAANVNNRELKSFHFIVVMTDTDGK